MRWAFDDRRVESWVLRINIAIFAFAVFCIPSKAKGDEPAAKAVEKAFSKAVASKAVDDAFRKASAPAPKPAAQAVNDAFEKAKAAKPAPLENPTAPERLPMPRQVALSEWYIDSPAPPCDECKGSCKCVDCVCQSTEAKAKPEPRFVQVTVDRWEKPKQEAPKRKEWTVGRCADGTTHLIQVELEPNQSVEPIPKAKMVMLSAPVSHGAPVVIQSSCPSGQCPNAKPAAAVIWR